MFATPGLVGLNLRCLTSNSKQPGFLISSTSNNKSQPKKGKVSKLLLHEKPQTLMLSQHISDRQRAQRQLQFARAEG